MAEINCAMWNCSGLLPSSSAKEKMDFINSCTSNNFDILVLIETHHKLVEDISEALRRYKNKTRVIESGVLDGDSYAGIAVLISSRLTVSEETELIKGRLHNFKLKCMRKEYNVSVYYGYTSKNASQTKIRQTIQYLTAHHKRSDNNVILGDFNFVDDDLDRTNKSKSGKNQLDKTLAKPWNEFLATLGLSDPFRLRNPKRRMYSYIHTKDNSKSRIDRIYVNDENCNDVLSYKHIPTPFCKAHRMVTFTLKEENERGPGFWKMNTSILKDRAYKILVESIVSDVISLGIDDPIERWLVFTETVAIDTRAYCARKRAIERRLQMQYEMSIEKLEENPTLSQNIGLHREYEYYTAKLSNWQRKQIEGHQARIKTQPRLEPGEPNISFFADLEKKESKKKSITHLMDTEGTLKYDTEGMKEIATDYYTKLFDIKKTDGRTATRLLQNIKKQINSQQKAYLDEVVTNEELDKVIPKLQKHKTPGPDGIPAEFYQEFWHLFDDIYLEFINAVKQTGLPRGKNTSITTLFYKERGEIFLLSNYRPIALMNVDVKIITKLLSMRLQTVLPTIIHESQTAVFGRQIGNSVHLVRDIIDYANVNDEGAALLFIDQEKAFDRVSHKFLSDVMKAFGFGDYFIHWIQILYSNAHRK